jgi:Docking domain of Afi1 for Arf3 in vesicle trafficking
VEYILVASFDIDKGPIMEHQYPVAITGDEHMLAELMLPDQAHVRNQDWTIFFLHKDTSQEEEEAELKAEQKRKRQRRRDRAAGLLEPDDVESGDQLEVGEELAEDSEESEPEGGEGPPLIYVLNLVNTKQDKTAKRGAVVKAMAICTRHPFLHIYKVCTRKIFLNYSNTQAALTITSPRRILQIAASCNASFVVRGR